MSGKPATTRDTSLFKDGATTPSPPVSVATTFIDKQKEIVNKEIHENAKTLAKGYINDYANILVLQAKVLAHKRKDDQVLSTHIEEALDIIRKDPRKNWPKELLIILGSALVGAFLSGFVTEFQAGRMVPLAIYTFMGFVGLFMIFFGLQR